MAETTLTWPKNYNEVPKAAFTRADLYADEIKRMRTAVQN